MITHNRIARAVLIACAALSAGIVPATPHLIVTSQDATVGKEIAVYEPDGTKVFQYITEENYDENTPTFIAVDPATRRFVVTCPGPTAPHNHRPVTSLAHEDPEHSHGHSVLIFDYSRYPDAPITLVEELFTGMKPYHVELSPDGKFVVCNDTSDTLSIIDPADPDHFHTVSAGHDHTTLVFAGDASGYDIYASRFGNPGGMDIVDGATLVTRATLGGLPPNPHTGVYSSHTRRVYFGGLGGVMVFGTQGAEKDTYIGAIPIEAGRMIPLSRISPDGKRLIGGVHYDGVAGSYFYSLDLTNDTLTTCSSVSCKYYAYSPDGKWIVAGDYNKPAAQTYHKVHVINCDPDSPRFMTVVAEFDVPDSRIGFQAADFSPDSRHACLGLSTSDKLMVVDVTTLSATYHDLPLNSAPKWLRVLPVDSPPATRAQNWSRYE